MIGIWREWVSVPTTYQTNRKKYPTYNTQTYETSLNLFVNNKKDSNILVQEILTWGRMSDRHRERENIEW